MLAAAAVLGLTDVDAMTVSMARGAPAPLDTAAAAMAIGIVSNTVLKLGIAPGLGSRRFKTIVGGTLLLLIAAVLVLLPPG